MDGGYAVDARGQMTVTVTPAQLRRLETAFAWAQMRAAAAQSQEEALVAATKAEKTLAKQSPGLAARIWKAIGSPSSANGAAWVAAVAAVLAIFLSNNSQSVEERVIEELLDQRRGVSQIDPALVEPPAAPKPTGTPEPPTPGAKAPPSVG